MMLVPDYFLTLVLAGALASQTAPEPPPFSAAVAANVPASEGAVREALRQGGYPWYDSGADRVRPIWAPSWQKWLRDRFESLGKRMGRFFERFGFGGSSSGGLRLGGEYLGTSLLATVLAAFFVFLIVLWLRREPFGAASTAARSSPGTAHLLAQLPEELTSGFDDPWAESQRRRSAGDLAGAVIYLFAHQLLSLHRAGLIRLAPGWTGRYYVRWLRDPVLVDSLGATLRLFEEIYYGHRRPSEQAFEQVWSRALALEARRGELEASP
jgi:Domain of unknown function (DUF4129)